MFWSRCPECDVWLGPWCDPSPFPGRVARWWHTGRKCRPVSIQHNNMNNQAFCYIMLPSCLGPPPPPHSELLWACDHLLFPAQGSRYQFLIEPLHPQPGFYIRYGANHNFSIYWFFKKLYEPLFVSWITVWGSLFCLFWQNSFICWMSFLDKALLFCRLQNLIAAMWHKHSLK